MLGSLCSVQDLVSIAAGWGRLVTVPGRGQREHWVHGKAALLATTPNPSILIFKLPPPSISFLSLPSFQPPHFKTPSFLPSSLS